MIFSWVGVFIAGILTFLSPCVLPLAPILLANLLSVKNPTRFDRLRATLWFSVGFSAVFILLGLSLPVLSTVLGSVKPLLLGAGGIALAAFGMRMMGMLGEGRLASWMTRSYHFPEFTSKLPRGLHGIGLGALFGLSWTPCVGPVLGGVLTYVASQEVSPVQGALLLGTFALGISIPLLGLAVGAEYLTPLFGRLKRHLPRLEYAVGLGLFFFGVYVVSQSRLQDFSVRGTMSEPIAAMDDQQKLVRLEQGQVHTSRMVFFYSENCPVCHRMQTYLPDFEKSCSSSHFELVRINVDLPQNQKAASHFGVRAVPTISVLNDKGAELVHLVGFQTPSRLREAARTVTQLACAKQELLTPSAGEEKFSLPSDKNACNVGVAC